MSLPSPKLPWPFPNHSTPGGVKQRISSLLWRIGSNCTVSFIGMLGRIWLEYLNKTEVHNRETWIKAVESRAGRPLVTISNHACCIDDPILYGLLPWRVHLRPRLMRWTLGADDVCFTRPAYATFFVLGKTAPIVRGRGVYQRGLDFMVEKLNERHYVHVFPEGGVNVTHDWRRLKWGVARIVMDAKVPPLVIPIWHEGLEDVLPNRSPYIPKIGKKVTVVIGDVIDTLPLLRELGWHGDHGGHGVSVTAVEEDCKSLRIREGKEMEKENELGKARELFLPDQEAKILKMYSLETLTTVEVTRKKVMDHFEEEMRRLRDKTRLLHFD